LKVKKRRLSGLSFSSRRSKLIGVLVGVLALVPLAGLAVSKITYGSSFLPNTKIAGIDVSGNTIDQAVNTLSTTLNSSEVTLVLDGQTQTYTAPQIGITIQQQDIQELLTTRSLVRQLFPYVGSSRLDTAVGIDRKDVMRATEQFTDDTFIEPVSADFGLNDSGGLAPTPSAEGFGVNVSELSSRLRDSYSQSMESISVTLQTGPLTPPVTESEIESKQGIVQLIIGQSYTINDVAASVEQIVGWLDLDEQKNVVVDQAAVGKFVDFVAVQLEKPPVNEVTSVYVSGKTPQITTAGVNGTQVTNKSQIAAQLVEAVQKSQGASLSFEFSEVPFDSTEVTVDDSIKLNSYTYSVEIWGTTQSDFNDFKAKAAATLADGRGWAGGGNSFTQVSSGGNFTLVLASPERVESAAPICSAVYSCRVGRNVIINDNRWRTATDSWNSAGGSLRDYQHMVINHEVGHWLGNGHSNCPGTGQPAPVMQQQSINLQGCTFNPWPLASEL